MNNPKVAQVGEPARHYAPQNVRSTCSWHNEGSLVLWEANLATVGHQVEVRHEVADVKQSNAQSVSEIGPLSQQGQLQVRGNAPQHGRTWLCLWIHLQERKQGKSELYLYISLQSQWARNFTLLSWWLWQRTLWYSSLRETFLLKPDHCLAPPFVLPLPVL